MRPTEDHTDRRRWIDAPSSRWFARFVYLVLALVIAGMAFTQTRAGRERMARLTTEALKTELGLDATFGSVAVEPRLFAFAFVAEQVVLRRSDEDFLTADRVEIQPSLWAFLRGKIDFDRVVLERPVLDVVMDEGRWVNAPVASRSGGGPARTSLPIQELVLTQAVVRAHLQDSRLAERNPLDLELAEADVTLLSAGSEVDVSLRVASGELSYPSYHTALEEISLVGTVDLESTHVALDELELSVVGIQLAVRDADIDPDRQSFRGAVSVEADLSKVSEVLAVRPTLSGQLSSELDVRADGMEVYATGRVDGRGIWLNNRWGLGDEFSLEVDVSPERIEIGENSRTVVLQRGGEARLSGTIELDEARGFPTTLRADIARLDFEKLMSQFSVTDDTVVRWPLSGQIALSGTLLPFDLEGPLRLSTSHFEVLAGSYRDQGSTRILAVDHGEFTGRWRFDDEAASFFQLDVRTPRSHADVRMVRIGYDNTILVDANLDEVDLQELSPLIDFPITGTGRTSVRVEGSLDGPRVYGTAAFSNFTFDGYRAGDLSTDWSLREDYVAVLANEVRAHLGQSDYVARNLVLDFATGVSIATEITTGGMSLQDLYTGLQLETDDRFVDYQGLASGRALVTYSLGQSTDPTNGLFQANLAYEIDHLTANGLTFSDGRFAGLFTSYDLSQGVDAASLEIEEFTLSKGSATLNIQGGIRARTHVVEGRREPAAVSALAMQVALDALPLEEVEHLNSSLQGSVGILGSITGTSDVPHAELDIALSHVAAGDLYIGGARFGVILSDAQSLRPNARREVMQSHCTAGREALAAANWPAAPPYRTNDGLKPRLDRPMAFLVCGEALSGQLAVDVALGWTDVYPIRGKVSFEDVDLGNLLNVDAYRRTLGGRVHGELAFTNGDLKHLESVSASLTLDRVRLRTRDYYGEGKIRLRNDGDVLVNFAEDGFHVAQARFVSDDPVSFSLAGDGVLNGSLNLDLEAHLGLDVLERVFPTIGEARGNLDVDLSIGGNVADPSLEGRVYVTEGALRLEGLPLALSNLRGAATFDGRRAVVDGLVANMGGGEVTVDGELAFRDRSLGAYRLGVALSGVNIAPMTGVELSLGGELALSGEGEGVLPRLEGSVDVERSTYARPIQLTPTLGQLYRAERVTADDYDPASDLVAFDIKVRSSTPLQVRNNLFEGEVIVADAERPFRIVGTNQRYGAIGTLSIPRGLIHFRSTDFQVTRGDIRFEDEQRIDPDFDVLARTEVQRRQSAGELTAPTWAILLRAHGDLGSFRLDASSEPSLSSEDIMLLLTIGMTSLEASQLQAGDVGGTALEALSALSGVNEEVTSALRIIDEFAVTTMYSPQSGRPEPMLTVAKRITDRLRISAATGLTTSSDNNRAFQTALELQTGESSSVQLLYDNVNRSTSSSFGNLGVDLHWRIDFE